MRIINKTVWKTSDLRRIVSAVAADELDRLPDVRRRLVVTIEHSRSMPGDTRLRERYASVLKTETDAARREWLESMIASPSGCRGWALVGGTLCVLRVPREVFDPVQFAWLAAHELAHVRGMEHGRMPESIRHYTVKSIEVYRWAAHWPVAKRTAPPPPTRDEVRSARAEHIDQMIARAETRYKRASTILSKWRRKKRELSATMRRAAGKVGGAS